MDYSEFLPVIDVPDGLKRMMNNKKLYARMMGQFKGRQMADDVIAQIQAGDFEKTAECAHALKGVAGNLSMPTLREAIIAIEANAKAEEDSADLIGQLNDAVDGVIEAIGRLIVNGEMI